MKLVPCVEIATGAMHLIDIETADTNKYFVPGFAPEANRNDDDILGDVRVSESLKATIEKDEYETAISKNPTINKKK